MGSSAGYLIIASSPPAALAGARYSPFRMLGNILNVSPRVPHHSLAGVAARDIRKLAFKGAGDRPSVRPLHLRGCGRQRSIARLCRAVHDEARTGQRLERCRSETVLLKLCAHATGPRSFKIAPVTANDLSVRKPSSLRVLVTVLPA